MTNTFEDILNMPATDIKPPKPLPVGTYLCLIDGIPEFTKVGEKQTDCVVFNARVMMAGPDVDQQQLAEFDGGVTGKMIRIRQFVTPDSKHRIATFLSDHLGIEKTTLKQMISESPGRQVNVKIKHRVDTQTMAIYNEVESTSAP